MLQTKKICLFLLLVLFLIIPSPIQADNQEQFQFISIEEFENHEIKTRYKNLPSGEILFDNIPFMLPSGENPKLLATHAGPLPTYPQRVILNTETNFVKEIYILINGGNVWKNNLGEIIGKIDLSFSDESTLSTNIKIGFNLRDWILNSSLFVHTTSSPNIKEVWRGTTSNGSGPVVVDMLKINIPSLYQKKTLKLIDIQDQSLEIIQNADPALQIFAITIKREANPLVLIPGFSASWNKEALLQGTPSDNGQKIPIFWPYNNLKNTLISPGAGYVEGEDYFEFYYDYRKNINDLADDLNSYLENEALAGKPAGSQVDLLGHSMGGLVARAYANKYGDQKIRKIITAGSPHKGVLKSYYAWEGGQADDHPSLRGILFNLLLRIYKNRFDQATLKDTVQAQVPSVKNMLPVFNFLKNIDGSVIEASSMIEQNNFFPTLIDPDGLKQKMVTFFGQEDNPSRDTAEYYLVQAPSNKQKALGLWPDGFPVGQEKTLAGDLTVLSKSATLSGVLKTVSIIGDHTEIIESQKGIEAILESLDISDVNPVTNFSSPVLADRFLLFLAASPVEIRVTLPNNQQAGYEVINPDEKSCYSQEDKLIFINDAPSGNYEVELIGTDHGPFSFYFSQTAGGQTINQTIKDQASPGQTTNFTLEFNPGSLQENSLKDPTGKIFLTLAKQELEELNNYLQTEINQQSTRKRLQSQIKTTIRKIDRALNYLQGQNYYQVSRYIFSSLKNAYQLRQQANNYFQKNNLSFSQTIHLKNSLEEIDKNLNSGWLTSFKNSGQTIRPSKIQRYKKLLDRMNSRLNPFIEAQANQGENKHLGIALDLFDQKKERGESCLAQSTLEEAYINFVSGRLLLLEISQFLH